MFEEIEEIYIENNIEGKKYTSIILVGSILTLVLMIVLFIMKHMVGLYIIFALVILVMLIFKVVIYIYNVKPKRLLELICIKNIYERNVYIRTKMSLEKLLKKKDSYNIESVKALIDYYKDARFIKKVDISKIFNGIISLLSVLGVLVTLENVELINALYKTILCVVALIVIFLAESKFLNTLSDGILNAKVNFNKIYKMFNEIYLDIITNRDMKETVKIEEEKNSYIKKGEMVLVKDGNILKTIIIAVILIIIGIILDYSNILTIININYNNFNFEFLNIFINSMIILMLYLITYFLIDKENIRKNNTQKDILKSLLKETYKQCIDYINMLDYETLSKYIVSKIDFNSNQESAIEKKLKNNPFSNHNDIVGLFKSGIITVESFDNYIRIKNDYYRYISISITFFDSLDKIEVFKNDLLSKLKEEIKNMV